MKIQVGDVAPDFSTPDQNGKLVSLSDFRGKAVVLYFYPRDDTPGCTREAKGFRDSFQAFTEAGAVVIGVSADSQESHLSFAACHRLPFPLLSDADWSLRKSFGVPRTLGILDGRVTYVLDGDGVLRDVFVSQFFPDHHVTRSLKAVRRLADRG